VDPLGQRLHPLHQRLAELVAPVLLVAGEYDIWPTAASVRELAVRLDADVAAVKARCARAGVNPGVDIQALSGRESDRGGLLVAITEQRTRADIDRLADVLGAAVAAERQAAVPA